MRKATHVGLFIVLKEWSWGAVLLAALLLLLDSQAHGRRHLIRHGRQRRQHQHLHHFHHNVTLGLKPGSYQESGPWGPWTASSSCSRTCGGGVAYQTRVCEHFRHDGLHGCTGPSRKYFSCNVEECPVHTKDFREEQCARFNSIPFEGRYYNWMAYYNAANPCELNCKPKGGRFYHRHSAKTIDGTRCHDDGSLDVCVDGACMPVGCDKMLGSDAVEDKCRVCRGDGSSCSTVEGVFNLDNLKVGYNDILLIPSGATNIRIEEKFPTNNYLAVRNETGYYYLNGNWRIELSRSVRFAGTVFHYELLNHRANAPESLVALGPTIETIVIVLLYQEKNLGITYEYSVPHGVSQRQPDMYSWNTGDFGECSQTCGGGAQSRLVYCTSATTFEKVSDDLCNPTVKPQATRVCNPEPCPATWYVGEWEDCSKSCGNGTQERLVFCQRHTEVGSLLTADSDCKSSGPRPERLRDCSSYAECASWKAGNWTECDRLCGEGTQIREVVCINPLDGETVEVLDDSGCDESKKPPSNQTCELRPCDGTEWVTSPWSGQSQCELPCSSRIETRQVLCTNEEGIVFPNEYCDDEKRPNTTKPCDEDDSALDEECQYMWHYSKWSPCSTECGNGMQTRKVFCVSFIDGNIVNVTDDNCNPAEQLNSTRECTVEALCNGTWVAAPWNQCSTPCGGGQRTRTIICHVNGKPAAPENCDVSKKPFDTESCNMNACDEAEGPDFEGRQNCTESLYGCCEDNVTFALGSDGEGCCVVTEFGCCRDNVTAATAADGCLCNTTVHGCCPDNVTVALGPEYVCHYFFEGCACEHHAFGCCPDKKSPAEGPDLEGCVICTNTTFGCCPDDSTAALGPNFEGCEGYETNCTTTTFGCCPDGVQAAEGEKFAGCTVACEGTPFGCCPNGLAPASGIGFEGCDNCSESLYGCCADNTSFALGPDGEGCCFHTEFGCCLDNKTEAQGLDWAGCSCHTTPHGCCPDGIATASGPRCDQNNRNCGCRSSNEIQCRDERSLLSYSVRNENTTKQLGHSKSRRERYYGCTCHNYPFGCCQDKHTPADGPDFEGCICSRLLYGCCPDDVTPAEGPDMAGCPCQITKFGCCLDQRTPARGPNLAGCGCDTMPYGCCPDQRTPARVPGFGGCPCTAMPYGCCPDHYTAAQGPDGRGCECEKLLYGCCPNGRTPATGPSLAGCTCHHYPYGCCPDGQTPFRGPEYDGCTCAMTAYGCCPDGVTAARGRNFEGCQDTTVMPTPNVSVSVCGLREEHGPCHNYMVYWFFSVTDGRCNRFWYGGCEGNGNRFNSEEECKNTCVKPEGPDACLLPKVIGTCDGQYQHWYFDATTRSCESFMYGGCLGNNNRFASKDLCEQTCLHQEKLDPCEPSAAPGPCRGSYKRFYYDRQDNQCKRFTYGGCQGNANNFATEEECSERCLRLSAQEICILAKEEGRCLSEDRKWYYDYVEGRCKEFVYTGCQGNRNRFNTRDQCERMCNSTRVAVSRDICALPKEEGPCRAAILHWHYNMAAGRCEQFYYGGCDGNENNFASHLECEQTCGQPASTEEPEEEFRHEFCFMPSEAGPCTNMEVRWFYDKQDGVCREFHYGGCLGNRNRFRSRRDCEDRCFSSQDLCMLPKVQGPCSGTFTQWFYDPETDRCHEFTYGGCQGNANRFNDREACENQCREGVPVPTEPPIERPTPLDVCTLPKQPGPCYGLLMMWYFDTATRECRSFTYGGCEGNDNRFESRELCEQRCGHHRAGPGICKKTVDPGHCSEVHERWFYDAHTGVCLQFVYTGCGGNKNRFKSAEMCMKFCSGVSRSRTFYVELIEEKKREKVCKNGSRISEHNIFNNRVHCGVSLGSDLWHYDENRFMSRLIQSRIIKPWFLADLSPPVHRPAEMAAHAKPEVTANAGSDVTLSCLDRPFLILSVTWTFRDELVESNKGRFKILVDGSLHISQLTGDDAGPYRCTADDGRQKVSHVTNLVVFVPATIKPSSATVTVTVSSTARLLCLAVGHPTPIVQWYRHGKQLPQRSARYAILADFTLAIQNVTLEDEDIYMCRAYNYYGQPAVWKVSLSVLPLSRESAVPGRRRRRGHGSRGSSFRRTGRKIYLTGNGA
nr:papilin-like [Dermacentor andersoni]